MGKTKSENERNVGVFRWDGGASYDPITKRSANKYVADRLADWIPGRCAIAMARPGEPLPKIPVRASRKNSTSSAIVPWLKSTEEGYKKAKNPTHIRLGLSANPNQNLTERYVSAIDSNTDRAAIIAVSAWSRVGLTSDSGLFE